MSFFVFIFCTVQKEPRLECKDKKQDGGMEIDDSDEDFEKEIEWLGQRRQEQGRDFYFGAKVDGLELSQGDVVLVESKPGERHRVATIAKIFDSSLGARAHLQYFNSA